MPMFLSSRGKMDYKPRPVGQHGSEDVLRSLGGSRSPTGSGGQLNLILCTEMFAGPHWEAPAFLAVGTAKTQTQEVGWGVQEIRVAGVSSPRGRGGIVRNGGKPGKSQTAEGLMHLAKVCELVTR